MATRRETLNQLPKPQPMSSREDVQDYLDMFEDNMKARELAQATWAHHLLPLLNPTCKTAVATLPLEARYDYAVVKETLLSLCLSETRYPGQQALDIEAKARETLQGTMVHLTRLVKRYALEDDANVVRSKMAMELLMCVSMYVRKNLAVQMRR